MATDTQTTATVPAAKMLVFDGDCPMCQATVGWLLRLGLVRAEQAHALASLSEQDAADVRDAEIRNQLVVIDPATREIRRGSAALVWIIGANTGQAWLVSLLSLPGVRDVLNLGYQAISYNRRIISPPRSQIVCDCEPEVTLARRMTLVIPLAVMTLGIAALVGAATFHGWQLGDAATGALFGLSAFASGCALLKLLVMTLMKRELRIDYLSHLAVTMFAGALVLSPAAAIEWWLPRQAGMTLLGVLLGLAVVLMYRMQRKRVSVLRLPNTWLWTWGICLATGAAATWWWFLGGTL